MSNEKDNLDRFLDTVSRVISDVVTSFGEMDSSIIAAAALGGLCLFGYKVIQYYTHKFNHKVISIEHGLIVVLIILTFGIPPVLGVVFAGMYGITNVIAAWQIGLTTPLIIESAYIYFAERSKKGKYHNEFSDTQPDA